MLEIRHDAVHMKPLDGFRGVAVMAVVCFHMYILACPGAHLFGLGPVLLQGWAGVDLFFVLSGFLITGILLQARPSPDYYKTFYTRRALRIFPLFYLVCATGMFLYPVLTSTPAAPFQIQIWYWLNCSNLLTALKPNAISWADPFWSLAIEEQFYLLWPLLLHRWTERRLALACLIALPTEYLLRLLPYVQQHDYAMQFALPPQFSYRLTPLHTDGIIAGSLLALAIHCGWVRREHVRWLRVATVAGAVLFCIANTGARMNFAPLAQLRFTALAIFGSGVVGVLALSDGRGPLARIFSFAPLRMLGTRSFCIYLVHIPVWIAVAAVLRRLHLAAHAAVAVPLTLCITLAVAAASWRYFEQPILTFKRRFRYAVPARLSLVSA